MKRSIFVLVVLIIITSLVGSACVPSRPGDNSQNDESHYSVASDSNDNSPESDTEDSESENASESLKESENESESESENESDSSPESTSESEIDEDIEPTDAKWFKFTLLEDGSGYSVECAIYNMFYPTQIVIPKIYENKPVKVIGSNAFLLCQELTSVIIPNSVTSIGDGAFDRCSSLKSVVIPNSVESIGQEAFRDCGSLANVTIPYSVTSIGSNAFSRCNENLYLIIDKLIYVDNWLIGVESEQFTTADITTANIKEGTKGIANTALYGCSKLTEVTIPNSLENIGERAFVLCSKLTSVTIPNSVVSIGEGAFSDCENLERIEVASQNKAYYSVDNCLIEKDTKTLIAGCKNSVIPSNGSVEIIGVRAFGGCFYLTSIVIPNGVTEIKEGAFASCFNLMNVIISDSVEYIGDVVFQYCFHITNVAIPKSVKNIGEGVFSYCENIENLEVSPENKAYCSINNCLIEKETKTLIAGCKNSIIPTDGSVEIIGKIAFSGCGRLTNIIIPNSVTSIGDYAFAQCGSLTNVVFEGTKEQWKELYKDGIFAGTKVSVVKCSDGDVEI